MTQHRHILIRTRTGIRLHLALPDSSVTRCGHWLKVRAAHFQVRTDDVDATLARHERHLCGRCGTPETFRKALLP